MDLAPIALFVYNRPVHTRRTLEALKNNYLADQSTLYIYADGPKTNASKQELDEIYKTRQLLREQKWCKEVVIIESPINKGCNRNILEGITEIFTKFNKLIVVEDDIETSKGFLKYMNEALDLYENDNRVMHISGYFPPTNLTLPETYFIRLSQIWGWATWKRAWDLYNMNADELMQQIASSNRIDEFNLGGYFYAFETLKSGNEGVWDTKWYASLFLANGLALTPKISLTQNIGHDGSGINCGENKNFFIKELAENIDVKPVKVIENKKAINEYRDFLIKQVDSSKSKKNILQDYIPKKIITIGKSLVSTKYQEFKKIEKLPYYKDCRQITFNIFKNPIKIYNSDEFFHQFDEIFNNEVFKFNSKNSQPIIIDIGASIGLIAIYFKTLFPKSRVILYEEDFIKCEIQQYNMNSFGFSDVSVKSDDLSAFLVKHVTNINQKQIDFLKIDILRKEILIINQIKDILSNIDNLFIRYSSFHNKKQELNNILETLSDNGFRYYLNISGYKSQQPFFKINLGKSIDNQINIFAYKI